MTVNATIVLVAYVVTSALTIVLWRLRIWTLGMLMLASILLSFSFTQYSIQQRDVRHQSVIDAKICADAIDTANVINQFHKPVRNFMLQVASRVHKRMLTEKKGSAAYNLDKESEIIYSNLANSIKLVTVEQCTIKTHQTKKPK